MKQLTIYTIPDSQLGKLAVAHAQGMDAKIQVVDFVKTPLTETQIYKCLSDCGISGEELVNKGSYHEIDFPVSEAKEDDWIKLLTSNPTLLKYPIVKCEGKYTLLKNPSEISGIR